MRPRRPRARLGRNSSASADGSPLLRRAGHARGTAGADVSRRTGDWRNLGWLARRTIKPWHVASCRAGYNYARHRCGFGAGLTQMSSSTIIVPKGSAASDVYLRRRAGALRCFALLAWRAPRCPTGRADHDRRSQWVGRVAVAVAVGGGYAMATKFSGNAMPHVIIGKINAVRICKARCSVTVPEAELSAAARSDRLHAFKRSAPSAPRRFGASRRACSA